MDLRLVGLIFASLLAVIRSQVSLSLSVRFVIFEEVPNDTLIGNIATESRIRTRANMTTEEFETLRYEFLDQSSMQNLFTVKERTGNLLTSGKLDREIVCPFKELCLLEFDILVHSSLNVIIVSVEIEVKDINDHFPIFPSKVVTTSMIESSNNGSTLTLSEATDLDSTSINNIQNYEIIPNNDTFYLNASRKQNGGFDLKLVLRQSLDREVKDFYVFHIIARDGGNPSNMGSVEVNINVLDSNDNYPVFDQEFYTSDVKEGSAVGTSVVKVTATDKDIGENGQISYRFSSRQTDPNVDKLFYINSTSGVLSVKGTLVYEPNKTYKIYVDAMDQGEQPQVTQTTILVTVLDAGNNKPNVRVNFLAQTNAEIINNISVVSVLESSPQNSVIAHVTVDDTDSGQNGLIGCNLSDDSFSIKQLNSGKGYIVSIKTQLNREQIESHNITVTCFDHGTPKLSSSVFFKVIVTDTNDNAPKFRQHTYFASIEEGNVIGFIVDQVSAEDIDIGRNAKIMYYLDKDSGGKFAINSNTGVITANTIFDRESALRHLFTVLAVDSGNPPMTGTATVILTVKDKNDNAPEFDVPSFQFFTSENLPSDVSVGTLNAKDLDEGENKKISFSISPEFESTMPFVIYSDGLVKTARKLDRELQNKYKFKIIATDHGIPALSSTAEVVVYVVDDNDNSPIFRFPNAKNKTVYFSSRAAIGSPITRVEAFDSDEEGPNSYLMYSIEQGNEQDIFSIGKSTGNIYLKRNYPIVNDQEFVIVVSAKDMGQKPRETKHELKIVLQFTNTSAVAPILSENGTRNVIISIVVVTLTLVTSAAMITVIFLLRRKDKNQAMKQEPTHFSAVHAITNESQGYEKSTYMENGLQIQSPPTNKKKKEVSFSLDEDIDSVFTDQQFSQGQEKKTHPGQLKTLHLHQVHLKSHLDTDLQRNSQSTQFDDISQSSGETTNSDSGKGGSDMDIPNSTLQDGSTPFSYLDNRSKPTNHSSSGFHPAIAFKTKFNQVIKTNKNKSERTRKKQSKSETDMFVELKDTNRNSKGHNSLPMSTSRHYENVNSDHTDYDVDTRPENWVPSYV